MIWFIAIVTSFIPVFPVHTQSQQPAQSQIRDELADWIMQKVIEKSLENEKVKRQYISYDKYQETEDLTEQPPKVKKETFNIYGENGKSMERRVEINGKLIRENGKPSSLNFSDTLANKYLPRMIFRKTDEKIINGRGYFVLTFEPKAPPNQLPSDDMYDRGINRSTGSLWIDMEKFYVWKFESKIIEGFSAFLLGQAENFQLLVEQEEKFGIMVPKQVIVMIKYKFLWITTHEKIVSTYGNHRDSRNPTAL